MQQWVFQLLYHLRCFFIFGLAIKQLVEPFKLFGVTALDFPLPFCHLALKFPPLAASLSAKSAFIGSVTLTSSHLRITSKVAAPMAIPPPRNHHIAVTRLPTGFLLLLAPENYLAEPTRPRGVSKAKP